jgi:hypothetical protein
VNVSVGVAVVVGVSVGAMDVSLGVLVDVTGMSVGVTGTPGSPSQAMVARINITNGINTRRRITHPCQISPL